MATIDEASKIAGDLGKVQALIDSVEAIKTLGKQVEDIKENLRITQKAIRIDQVWIEKIEKRLDEIAVKVNKRS